jgi:hypothetical protein
MRYSTILRINGSPSRMPFSRVPGSITTKRACPIDTTRAATATTNPAIGPATPTSSSEPRL